MCVCAHRRALLCGDPEGAEAAARGRLAVSAMPRSPAAFWRAGFLLVTRSSPFSSSRRNSSGTACCICMGRKDGPLASGPSLRRSARGPRRPAPAQGLRSDVRPVGVLKTSTGLVSSLWGRPPGIVCARVRAARYTTRRSAHMRACTLSHSNLAKSQGNVFLKTRMHALAHSDTGTRYFCATHAHLRALFFAQGASARGRRIRLS